LDKFNYPCTSPLNAHDERRFLVAHFDVHCQDCLRLLISRCEDDHLWLDELAAKLGLHHRFARHHTRGIEEAGERFGELGRKAALIHVLRDSGHTPTPRQWKDGKVDPLGFAPNGLFYGEWDPHEFIRQARKLVG
jgi:hypothetical protein